MIVYDSKKWSWFFVSLFKTYKYSYNTRQLARLIFYSTIYAVVSTFFILRYLKDAYTIDTVFFSLIGVILSLFLVFRLNSGYERWWQGREAWGKLVNDARNFSLQMDTIISPDNYKRRKLFGRNIANFCTALVWHLRDDTDSAHYLLEEDSALAEVKSFNHQPNKFASHLYKEVEVMFEADEITAFDKHQTKSLIQGFIDVLGICERIKKTPIPFSHSAFIKMFIMLYIFILPFGLAPTFEYLTIPAVLVMAFAMLGIEVISEEIENPFGLDANDLPTGQLADTIRNDVYEILKLEHEEGYIVRRHMVRKEAEIFH